ncbi:MAG: hypothetical protein WEC39_01165 [Patescibacteria group bacterium]
MAFVLSDTESFQVRALERLLKSEIYYQRLRRTLINRHDPKVTTGFLVLDDAVSALLMPILGSEEWKRLIEIRKQVFSKARESAENKLDVGAHDQVGKMYNALLDHGWEVTAEQILDSVYGKPEPKRNPI